MAQHATRTSFKKGQVANPNGRPKRGWSMKSLIEEALEEQSITGVPKKKLIAIKLADLALNGDMSAIKEVNARVDGMPVQQIEQNTEGKLEISIVESNATDE